MSLSKKEVFAKLEEAVEYQGFLTKSIPNLNSYEGRKEFIEGYLQKLRDYADIYASDEYGDLEEEFKAARLKKFRDNNYQAERDYENLSHKEFYEKYQDKIFRYVKYKLNSTSYIHKLLVYVNGCLIYEKAAVHLLSQLPLDLISNSQEYNIYINICHFLKKDVPNKIQFKLIDMRSFIKKEAIESITKYLDILVSEKNLDTISIYMNNKNLPHHIQEEQIFVANGSDVDYGFEVDNDSIIFAPYLTGLEFIIFCLPIKTISNKPFMELSWSDLDAYTVDEIAVFKHPVTKKMPLTYNVPDLFVDEVMKKFINLDQKVIDNLEEDSDEQIWMQAMKDIFMEAKDDVDDFKDNHRYFSKNNLMGLQVLSKTPKITASTYQPKKLQEGLIQGVSTNRWIPQNSIKTMIKTIDKPIDCGIAEIEIMPNSKYIDDDGVLKDFHPNELLPDFLWTQGEAINKALFFKDNQQSKQIKEQMQYIWSLFNERKLTEIFALFEKCLEEKCMNDDLLLFHISYIDIAEQKIKFLKELAEIFNLQNFEMVKINWNDYNMQLCCFNQVFKFEHKLNFSSPFQVILNHKEYREMTMEIKHDEKLERVLVDLCRDFHFSLIDGKVLPVFQVYNLIGL